MYTPRPLDDKLAIITGSSRGIGGATAQLLASRGCNIVIHYNSFSSEEDAKTLATNLTMEFSVRCETFQADISTDDGPDSFIAAVKSKWTTSNEKFQKDVLINNAGMVHTGLLGEINVQDFFKV